MLHELYFVAQRPKLNLGGWEYCQTCALTWMGSSPFFFSLWWAIHCWFAIPLLNFFFITYGKRVSTLWTNKISVLSMGQWNLIPLIHILKSTPLLRLFIFLRRITNDQWNPPPWIRTDLTCILLKISHYSLAEVVGQTILVVCFGIIQWNHKKKKKSLQFPFLKASWNLST